MWCLLPPPVLLKRTTTRIVNATSLPVGLVFLSKEWKRYGRKGGASSDDYTNFRWNPLSFFRSDTSDLST